MLSKPKSEEAMKIVADLLELEKWLYSGRAAHRYFKSIGLEDDNIYIDGQIVKVNDYYKARQKQLFKELIELVDGKKV